MDCSKFARWFIGIFNAILLIVAVVCGVVGYKKMDQGGDITKDSVAAIFKYIKGSPIAITAICVLVFACISAIFGFFLICCKGACIRWSYLICIGVVVLVEVICVVVAFVYKGKLESVFEDNWMKADYKDARTTIEKAFKCCGYKDLDTTDCSEAAEAKVSCKDSIQDKIEGNIKTVMACLIVVLVFELLLLGFSLYLACCWHPEDDPQSITDIH